MNIIIEFVAVLSSGLSFCISDTAFIPNGVAAFPNPRRLAVTFIDIALSAGDSCVFSVYRSLNKILKIGLKILAKACVSPDVSAIFISPVHNAIIPNNDIIKFTASVAPFRIAFESASTRPVTIAENTLISIINAHM